MLEIGLDVFNNIEFCSVWHTVNIGVEVSIDLFNPFTADPVNALHFAILV